MLDLDRLAQAESVFALSNGHIGLRAQPRRGRARRPARHLPQRLLRDAPAALRRGRLRLPRGRARRSSTSPTASSSACWSTTSRSTSATASCSRTRAEARPARRRAAPRGPLALARRPRDQAAHHRGWCRFTQRAIAAIDYEVEAVRRRRDADRRAVRARRQRAAARPVRGPRAPRPRCAPRSSAEDHDSYDLTRGARAPHARERPARGGRDGPLGRRARGHDLPHRRQRRPRPRDVQLRARAGRDAARDEAPGLRLVEPALARRRCATRPRPRSPRRSAPAGTAWSPSSAPTSTTSGPAPTSRSTATAASQAATRFGIFHTLQAGARAEARAIPAKGLTGPGYDGHVFWDTETYVLPVLSYTRPGRGGRRAELAGLDARPRDGARQAAGLRGRRVPVAHDPRPGVLGLLAGGHRGVPHQRRHRRRGAAPRARHRRRAVHDRARHCRCSCRRRGCGGRSATTTRRAPSTSTA